MPRYKLTYGLGGGMNTIESHVEDFNTQEQADEQAYQLAVDDYESYAGMHGLMDYDEALAEAEGDEDDAQDIYNESREGWLEYHAELVPDDTPLGEVED